MDSLKARIFGLLRRSERYTKTDMVYAASGGFWLGAGQTAAILFSIPTSLAFAHFLTANEFGLYKYALSIASIVGIFSLTGIATGISRSAARGYDGSLHQGFWLSLKTSWPVVVLSFIMAAYYAVMSNLPLAIAMSLIAVLSPLFNASMFFSAFLNGKRTFRPASVYNVWRNLIGSASLLLAIVLSQDPLIILAVYFISYAVTGLYFSWRAERLYAKNHKEDADLNRFSFHTSVINGLSVLADRLDSVLLFQNIGAAQLALYSFAEMVPDAINRLAKNVTSLALPKYAVRRDPGTMVHKTLLLSLALLPVVLAYILAAPYLFALLLPMYIEAVPYTQALAAMMLINGSLPVSYLDAQAALKRKYALSILSSITKIIFLIVGIWLWGIWGAVIGRAAAKAAGLIYAFILVYVPSFTATQQ